VRDGGLREAEALGGAGDVALLEQRVEGGEEIQVDTGQPHVMSIVNSDDENNRFCSWEQAA
jgi:hypothetical protein